ncbi:MAG: TonB C-terminal domain-containing protein [Calothrix sp. SM1_5_4]|nr:TonB C-terminal domain-containing protein [Calothrix sp. SM1_5_4]
MVRQYVSRLSERDLEQLARVDRETVVEIVLSRKGEFTDSAVLKSSGDRALDQTGVEALRDAAPFLNPPAGRSRPTA